MNRMIIQGTCPACRSEWMLAVDSDSFDEWRNGALIQRAFYYLSAGERELLMSGMCEPCFDSTFAEEDSDESA